jgi:hypothetical protein
MRELLTMIDPVVLAVIAMIFASGMAIGDLITCLGRSHHHWVTVVRLPPELHSKLEVAATARNRSLHAEVIRRLEVSLEEK